MSRILDFYQDRVCCGVSIRIVCLYQYIASYWQVFHPYRCILRVVVSSLVRIWDGLEVIIIFHDGVIPTCIWHLTPG